MDTTNGSAAPESGTHPSFEQLCADPEIAALLDFEPSPRQVHRPDGWHPELQRELIARLADTGTPQRACQAMGKNASGAKHLNYKPGAESFRAAWKAAIALFREREKASRAAAPRFTDDVPGFTPRRARGPVDLRTEREEDWTEAERRHQQTMASMRRKLLGCRNLLLEKISRCPGKRAAWEILTEQPVDWDRAARLQPQQFDPIQFPSQHRPDMVLTAESGWSFGEIGYGPDRKKEAREGLNAYLIEEGKEPIDWDSLSDDDFDDDQDDDSVDV